MNSTWQRLNRRVIQLFGSLTRLRRKLMRPLPFKIEQRRIEAEKIELPLDSFDESQLLSSIVSSDEMLDRRLLRDMLELALSEARRMHKDYLGTPHLFIALTRLEGGRTQDALRSLGRSPEQVSGTIRCALGSGKATSDTPIEPTRRCREILQRAERNAINAHSTSVDERAIAQAVLSEEGSVLRELLTKHGINPSRLIELITEGTPIDFAFVTALPKERNAVLKYLSAYKRVQVGFEPQTYYRGRIDIPTTNDSYEVVVIMLLGMGNGEAAIGSMEVLRRWHPANVIMVGIAGGVFGKVELGDVVVANSIFYYELAKRTSKGEQRRGQYFSSDRLLYDRALAYEANDWMSKISIARPDTREVDTQFPKVHFGTIASGEKILADERTLTQLLHECPELLAVGMEGAGVARAASHQTPPTRFLEVRTICDFGNEQKNDDWQAYAAEAAASFTISLLRSRPVPPIGAA